MIVGIDGSNIRSGGGVTHLTELINHIDPEKFGITKVFVWSSQKILEGIHDKRWLIKINHVFLNKNLPYIVLWRILYLEEVAKKCDLLVSVSGNYTGNFSPYVSYCRNMLVFDGNEKKRYSLFSLVRLRLAVLFFLQKKSFANAHTTVFLSEYAQFTVKNCCKIKNSVLIHHGVSQRFKKEIKFQRSICKYDESNRYKLLYVSIIDQYKHQWNIAQAIANLIQKGYPLEIYLIGKSYPPAMKKFKKTLEKIKPYDSHVHYRHDVPYSKIDSFYEMADAFIFGSTCENMPNILLEAMAAGLPVLSSDYPAIKEFLKNAGMYFDPCSVDSIERQIEIFINDKETRTRLACAAQKESENYSWEKCTHKTFTLFSQILNNG